MRLSNGNALYRRPSVNGPLGKIRPKAARGVADDGHVRSGHGDADGFCKGVPKRRARLALSMNRRVQRQAECRGLQLMHAFQIGLHRAHDGRIGDDGSSLVLCADAFVGRGDAVPIRGALLRAHHTRSKEVHALNVSRLAIEDHVDATESLAMRQRLDDVDPVDLMREPGVSMAGGDDVHEPARQTSRQPEDFGLRVARRQIRGFVELTATPAGMGGDDHDFGARRTKLRRFCDDRWLERRDAQPLNVGGDRRVQRIDRHDADDADVDARRAHEHRRPNIRPLDGAPGRFLDQIRGEEGIVCLGGACLERAAKVASGLPGKGRVDGPEVEVVIADRLCRVRHRVVRVNNESALAEIRLDVALKGIAGVDEQDRAAVCRTHPAEVVHVSREQGQTAESVSRQRGAVEVARADNRQRHERRVVRCRGDRSERCRVRGPQQREREKSRRHQQGDRTRRV